jgi:hypothetical protein
MHRRRPPPRRFLRGAVLIGVVSAIALASVPAASTTGIGDGLFAYVRVTKTGPLPACNQDGSNCGAANTFHYFLYVLNANRLSDASGRAATRATLPNSLVVQSVEQRVFVDGAEWPNSAFTFTPPPDPSYRPWSAHWPSTVACGAPGEPCNVVVGSPAVLPGENTAVFYGGWVHGSEEPNGSYVFKFTLRGTLEGNPVELHASSRAIVMTD